MNLLNQKKYRKYKPALSFLILIVGIFIAIKLSNIQENSKLKSLKLNYQFAQCIIKEVHYPMKSSNYINFDYIIKNESCSGHYSFGSLKNKSMYLSTEGKRWTIIYDTTDYENSALLLTLEDYKKYNVPYGGQEVLEID